MFTQGKESRSFYGTFDEMLSLAVLAGQLGMFTHLACADGTFTLQVWSNE